MHTYACIVCSFLMSAGFKWLNGGVLRRVEVVARAHVHARTCTRAVDVKILKRYNSLLLIHPSIFDFGWENKNDVRTVETEFLSNCIINKGTVKWDGAFSQKLQLTSSHSRLGFFILDEKTMWELPRLIFSVTAAFLKVTWDGAFYFSILPIMTN